MSTPQPQQHHTGEIDVLRLDIIVPMDQVPVLVESIVRSAFLSSAAADGSQTLAQVLPASAMRSTTQ